MKGGAGLAASGASSMGLVDPVDGPRRLGDRLLPFFNLFHEVGT